MSKYQRMRVFLLAIFLFVISGVTGNAADEAKWEQVLGNGHGPGSSFGNPANTSIDTLINIRSGLYASTWNNTTGTEIWKSTNGTTWTQLANDGFGDPKNATIHFATKEFKGYLYGGTDNSATTNEGVDIPGEGAEIFRSDGTTWQKVASDVFGKENIGFTSLIEFKSQLYGVSWNRSGMEIWRTQDGVNWNQVMKGGFGYERNQFAKAVQVFKDQLYIGTSWNNTTGGQVWRTKDGIKWEQANQNGFGDPANTDVTSLLVYGGKIYAGAAGSGSASAKIYESTNGTNWQAILTPGPEAGGIFAAGSTAMAQRQGMLYAATSSTQGIDIWRTKLEVVTPQTKPPLKIRQQKKSGWLLYLIIVLIILLIAMTVAGILILLFRKKRA